MSDPRRWRSRGPESPHPEDREEGAALILTLIFSILLYAIVSDLVTTARTARLTGESDALRARMESHMRYTLTEVEELLLGDLQSAAAAGEEGGAGGGLGGGLGGALGGAAGGGEGAGLGGEEEESEPEPSSLCDGSQDAWYEPTAYTDGDITTYVWCEDENSKFNILTLVSPDEEFALESRERFVRLIDALRDGTEWDLTRSDGEIMADDILDWMRSRNRTEEMPRPRLKSDLENERTDISLPLHLDELLLVRQIEPDLFYDKVMDGKVIQGLESVLTVYTSYRYDPGDPDDPNQQRALREDREAEGEEGGETPAPEEPEQPQPGAPPPQPEGLGIRININTATYPVLRCLFTPSEMSDRVIEAILEYRNEEEEEVDLGDLAPDDYLGPVDGGEQIKRKVFTSLDQLDEIPEYMNMPDPTVKDRMRELCGVESDVFSIHMASLYKRSEEHRIYVIRRSCSIMIRIDDGQDGVMHPISLLEERHGMRIKTVDFPEQSQLDQFARNDSMDIYSQEEKAWNPFLVEFYLPQDERERLFSYR